MADSLDSIASYLQTPYGGAVLFGLLIVYPMFRIFRRAGVPAWPAAFVFLPLFGLAVTFACLVLWKWRAAPAEQAGD
ncbi:MAG: hypothetical protein KDA64_07480 [Rhodospirillaceae bacterium]|nr:hypothetical protein [Rhodospirillaceae bacterium]